MTSFNQQTVPGIRVVLKVNKIIMLFVTVAISFILAGFMILNMTRSIPEIIIDYTKCEETPVDSNYNYLGSASTQEVNLGWISRTLQDKSKQCLIDFYVPETIQNPLFYYQLNNFYQSNRAYSKSYSYKQLLGLKPDDLSLLKDCGENYNKRDNKVIYPCGRLPNVIFNDTLVRISAVDDIAQKPAPNNPNLLTLPMTQIGWPSREVLYKPSGYSTNEVVAPENWNITYNTTDFMTAKIQSPEFRVWTHIAAFPNFRKLWKRLNTPIKQGYYRMIIDDSNSYLFRFSFF